MEAVLHWISQYGYLGIFALLMLGMAGLPIPDETLMMAAGYLIHAGHLGAVPAFFSALSGSICGISVSYAIGRTLGCPLIERYGKYFHLTPERLGLVERWFDKVGDWLLTVGYFIPAVRHVTALFAGISRMPYLRFAAFAYLGSFIWVTTFLGIGYVVGEHWREALEWIHRFTWVAVIIGAVVLLTIWLITQRRASSASKR